MDNFFANVRSSDGAVLGVVSDRYQVVQNAEAFAFTDALIGGEGQVHYETAGSLMGGRKIWLLAKLPDTEIVGDKTEPYLCFSNTHDGSGAIRVCMTPIRVVCNNTLNIALNGAKRAWSVRHTGDIQAKLQDSIDFAADGLFCEWAWVIDLDAGTFEGYCGFGQTPLAENDRFYFLRDLEEDNGYHGVRLAAKWNLDALPTDEEFLAAFKNDEEETPTF